MRKRLDDAEADEDPSPFSSRKIWRFGAWTAMTVISVSVAIVTLLSETGSRRLAFASATSAADPPRAAAPTAAQPPSRHFDAEIEARRLSEAVRLLATDRDRLLARISALERSLDDVTGSVPTAPAGGRPAASPLPPGLAPTPPVPTAPPAAALPAAEVARAPAAPPQPPSGPTVAQPQPPARGPAIASAPPDPGPAGSLATRTEFGIDIGGASTLDGLRTLWGSVKGNHEPLFEGLRPIIVLREGKPGAVELRLVAGPLANAGIAARLCAALGAAGLSCQPAVFDGQRLALR